MFHVSESSALSWLRSLYNCSLTQACALSWLRSLYNYSWTQASLHIIVHLCYLCAAWHIPGEPLVLHADWQITEGYPGVTILEGWERIIRGLSILRPRWSMVKDWVWVGPVLIYLSMVVCDMDPYQENTDKQITMMRSVSIFGIVSVWCPY